MLAILEQGVTPVTIMAGLFALLLVYILFRALALPLKVAVRALAMACLGLFWVMLFNVLGQFANLSIPLNPLTVIVSGFLGPLGPLALAVMQFILR
jgi:pro-sigmaK processing inhibitor BofA